MWITLTAMGGVSHAYITLIEIGMPRYGSDVWRTFLLSPFDSRVI